jgi:hypothetical protein
MSDDIEGLVGAAVVAWSAATDDVGYERVTDVLLAARELDPDALVRCALKMLSSAAAADRAVGCDAAGLVGEVREDWQEAVATAVLGLADGENDTDVLWSLVGALMRCPDVRAVPVLCHLATHADVDVRFGVAHALPFVMDDDLSGEAVETLLMMASDADDEVREWAIFGVGSMGHLDSRAIRRALRAGLDDPCEAVRVEAIHGLARRRDMTVLPLVAALLSGDSALLQTFTAAEYLGHPDLVAPLSNYGSADPGVQEALVACDPELRRAREDACYAVAAGVQAEFDRRRNGFSAAVACPLLDLDLELIVTTETTSNFGAFATLAVAPTTENVVAHILRQTGGG